MGEVRGESGNDVAGLANTTAKVGRAPDLPTRCPVCRVRILVPDDRDADKIIEYHMREYHVGVRLSWWRDGGLKEAREIEAQAVKERGRRHGHRPVSSQGAR